MNNETIEEFEYHPPIIRLIYFLTGITIISILTMVLAKLYTEDNKMYYLCVIAKSKEECNK